jgi:hypothetical protein
MDVMHQSAAAVKYFMHEGIPPDASFLTTEVVLEAEAAFVRAGGGGGSDGRRQAGAGEEGAVRKTPFFEQSLSKNDHRKSWEKRFSCRLPTDFVMLERWEEMRAAAAHASVSWPMAATKQQAFAAFAAQAAAEGVTQIRESGCTSITPWWKNGLH